MYSETQQKVGHHLIASTGYRKRPLLVNAVKHGLLGICYAGLTRRLLDA